MGSYSTQRVVEGARATPTDWIAIEALATICIAIAAFAAVYVTYRALKS